MTVPSADKPASSSITAMAIGRLLSQIQIKSKDPARAAAPTVVWLTWLVLVCEAESFESDFSKPPAKAHLRLAQPVHSFGMGMKFIAMG